MIISPCIFHWGYYSKIYRILYCNCYWAPPDEWHLTVITICEDVMLIIPVVTILIFLVCHMEVALWKQIRPLRENLPTYPWTQSFLQFVQNRALDFITENWSMFRTSLAICRPAWLSAFPLLCLCSWSPLSCLPFRINLGLAEARAVPTDALFVLSGDTLHLHLSAE